MPSCVRVRRSWLRSVREIASSRVGDRRLGSARSPSQVALHLGVGQLAMREVVGGAPIEDLLARRQELGSAAAELARQKLEEIGVRLRSLEVKDIMFPGPLKRVFAQVVEAREEGRAALEKARGETAALRNLANAARL